MKKVRILTFGDNLTLENYAYKEVEVNYQKLCKNYLRKNNFKQNNKKNKINNNI